MCRVRTAGMDRKKQINKEEAPFAGGREPAFRGKAMRKWYLPCLQSVRAVLRVFSSREKTEKNEKELDTIKMFRYL